MAITTASTKSIGYYNIFNLSLPLVGFNICDVNKKENNYSKINTLIHSTIPCLNLILPKSTRVIKETLIIRRTEHGE